MPCTGMKGFSALNRAINHEAWQRSRRVSVPLAKLVGLAAMVQMNGGRHFIAEHPQSSDLWMLPAWRKIGMMPQVVKVLVHQCMAGLTGPRSGSAIKKPNDFELRTSYLCSKGTDCTAMASISTHSWMRAKQEHQPTRLKVQPDGHCNCAIALQKFTNLLTAEN